MKEPWENTYLIHFNPIYTDFLKPINRFFEISNHRIFETSKNPKIQKPPPHSLTC